MLDRSIRAEMAELILASDDRIAYLTKHIESLEAQLTGQRHLLEQESERGEVWQRVYQVALAHDVGA